MSNASSSSACCGLKTCKLSKRSAGSGLAYTSLHLLIPTDPSNWLDVSHQWFYMECPLHWIFFFSFKYHTLISSIWSCSLDTCTASHEHPLASCCQQKVGQLFSFLFLTSPTKRKKRIGLNSSMTNFLTSCYLKQFIKKVYCMNNFQ